MQLNLSRAVGGRHTEYPAPVIADLTVSALDGRAHPRRWEGVIDTGADLSVIPVDLCAELHLDQVRQKVRVWTYRKEEQPRELDVYYLRLAFSSGLEVLTKAITAQRRNILIGRCALLKMRLVMDWPANVWSLEDASFTSTPKAR